LIFHTTKFYNLEEIFNLLVHTVSKSKKKKTIIVGELVKVSSLRLTTFKEKGIKCCSCDRVGTHFRLQRQFKEPFFHLALWSDDDVEMTKDHIVPKSKGGYDHLDNMQTMCAKCNSKKRNVVTEEDYANGYYDKSIIL
jgi:hypothetical protein